MKRGMKILVTINVLIAVCHLGIARSIVNIANGDTFDGSDGISIKVFLMFGLLLLLLQISLSSALFMNLFSTNRRLAISVQVPLIVSLLTAVSLFLG